MAWLFASRHFKTQNLSFTRKLKEYILPTFWRVKYKGGSENWQYDHLSSE